MRNYRRIEINAFRRRVTVTSGEWPRDAFQAPVQSVDEVSLNDIEAGVPVESDSPEGQLILIEAIQSLERRLLPEARTTLCREPEILTSSDSSRNDFFLKLQSLRQFIRTKIQQFASTEE
jgi:hypothetical protein